MSHASYELPAELTALMEGLGVTGGLLAELSRDDAQASALGISSADASAILAALPGSGSASGGTGPDAAAAAAAADILVQPDPGPQLAALAAAPEEAAAGAAARCATPAAAPEPESEPEPEPEPELELELGGDGPVQRAAAVAALRAQQSELQRVSRHRKQTAAAAAAVAAQQQQQQQQPPSGDDAETARPSGSDMLFLPLYMQQQREIVLVVPPPSDRSSVPPISVIFRIDQGGVPHVANSGAMDVGGIVWAASILLSQHILDRSCQLREKCCSRSCTAAAAAAADTACVGAAASGDAPVVRVLELGCGTSALPSLAASIAFAGAPRPVIVTATDLPSVLPSLRANLGAHEPVLAEFGASVPAAAPLCWGEQASVDGDDDGGVDDDDGDDDCTNATAPYADIDLLLVADCMYDVDSLPQLLTTLRLAIGQHTVALLAYQRRRREREEFVLRSLREAGYHVVDLDMSQLPPTTRAAAGAAVGTMDTFDNHQRAFLRIAEVRLGNATAAHHARMKARGVHDEAVSSWPRTPDLASDRSDSCGIYL
jgi:predicted nicotinamide N-methyase